MEQLTIDQAYNKIVKHFSEKGAQYGYDSNSRTCKYRQEKGGKVLKCAVGCLTILSDVGLSHLGEFLIHAQDIHDSSAHGRKDMQRFLSQLEAMYEDYKANN